MEPLTPLKRRRELQRLRDIEVAQMCLMLAKTPAERVHWMNRLEQLRVMPKFAKKDT